MNSHLYNMVYYIIFRLLYFFAVHNYMPHFHSSTLSLIHHCTSLIQLNLFFLICKYFAIFFSLFCIFFATALWLVVHRLHGAIRITAFTRIAIVLYALEILKDTYTYPYCTEAYDCNNYNLL